MSSTRSRIGAAIVFAAPAILAAGLIYHPYIAITRASDVAEAAASDPTRWGLSHLAVGLGYALVAGAFVAVARHLRLAGEERWSSPALPFVVVGSALTAILPGMEFAPLTAAETGGDVMAAQEELASWFVPIFVVSGLSFALGVLGFALAIARSGTLRPPLTRFVIGALVIWAVARFVPLGAVFYVTSAAAVAALWPLSSAMWDRREVDAGERQRPTPAF